MPRTMSPVSTLVPIAPGPAPAGASATAAGPVVAATSSVGARPSGFDPLKFLLEKLVPFPASAMAEDDVISVASSHPGASHAGAPAAPIADVVDLVDEDCQAKSDNEANDLKAFIDAKDAVLEEEGDSDLELEGAPEEPTGGAPELEGAPNEGDSDLELEGAPNEVDKVDNECMEPAYMSEDPSVGCPPLSADFFKPLPDGLSIGMSASRPMAARVGCPVDPAFVAKLAATPAPTRKDHLNKVNAIRKKFICKKPAAATGKNRSRAGGSNLKVNTRDAGPGEGAAKSVPFRDMSREEIIASCTSACVEGRRANPTAGRKTLSFQRGTHIFQIKDVETSRVVCQVTDKQMGSKERMVTAGDALLHMWNAGATQADLVRCKQTGCLFGIACGRKSV